MQGRILKVKAQAKHWGRKNVGGSGGEGRRAERDHVGMTGWGQSCECRVRKCPVYLTSGDELVVFVPGCTISEFSFGKVSLSEGVGSV